MTRRKPTEQLEDEHHVIQQVSAMAVLVEKPESGEPVHVDGVTTAINVTDHTAAAQEEKWMCQPVTDSLLPTLFS
jgi:histidine ammonia-lyase